MEWLEPSLFDLITIGVLLMLALGLVIVVAWLSRTPPLYQWEYDFAGREARGQHGKDS